VCELHRARAHPDDTTCDIERNRRVTSVREAISRGAREDKHLIARAIVTNREMNSRWSLRSSAQRASQVRYPQKISTRRRDEARL
jgi:hypothetical protein